MTDERIVGTSKIPPVDVVERRDLQSMLEIDLDTADPDYTYRFVRDEKLNISRKRMKGYRPVTKEDEVQTIVEADDSADGLIRVGDTILMKCPKSSFKRRRREALELSESRLRMPKKKVKNLARKHKVKLIQDEED